MSGASVRRPMGRGTVGVAVVALLALASRGRADDPARPAGDPWPLASGAPTQGADAARAVLDAADARRQANATARFAEVLDVADVVASPDPSPWASGRPTVAPAVAMRGLRTAASRSAAAQGRTVPEMMEVLAGVAFDGSAVAGERRILPSAGGTVDRVFQGTFQPRSIDDRPYVLQPSRLQELHRTPPAPPAPEGGARTAPPSPLRDLVVRGVRIELDEALLRRALATDGAPPEAEALDALEARALAATDGDAAARTLTTFAAERKAALVGRGAGEAGLRRVSLRALVAAAGTASDPGATCGGLTRLLGVACDPEGGDVALVGVVEPGAPAVPFDALCLALATVWRDGGVPGCSLDPDPKNPAGPQRVRVFGVPADSRFAKTMLDADYAMKRIVARAPGGEHGVEGLVDLPAAWADVGGELGSNRFWLTPAPPARGDVVADPRGAAALFETRVRVRTEGMQTAAFGSETGRGHGTPAADVCARSLSDHYEDLARRMPIFAELRTLFDVVACAQVLRVLAPHHPLLDRAAALPYVRAVVPKTYAGITVTHAVRNGVVTLQGGCDLDARVTERAFLDAPHPAFPALARAGADGALPGVRPASSGRSSARDEAVLAAMRPLREGAWLTAQDALSDLLADDPDDAEVLSLRAVARFHGGDRDGGLLDAEEASAMDPASPALEATWRHLRLVAEDPTALEGMRASVAEALEAMYVSTAAGDALAHRYVPALATIDRALRVRPASPTARILRATILWLGDDVARAAEAAAAAEAAVPDSAEAAALSGWIALQRGEAGAAVAALDRAVRLAPDAEALGMRAVARALDGDLAGAAGDAAQALAKDPSDFAVGLAVQTFRGMAVYGATRGRAVARAQLMLPAEIQLAVLEGQRASTSGDAAGAVEAYARALSRLEASTIPPAVRATALADETISFLLARALMDTEGQVPGAKDRIEAITAELEARHPTWVSPRWLAALAAQRRGDPEATLAAFERCRGMDPSGDPLLAQSLPADPRTLEQVLSILEMSTTLGLSEAEGARRMPGALDRLVAAYAGTPSAPAADGLRAFFTAIAASPVDDAALRARLRAAADATPAAGRGVPPGEAMVRAFLFAIVAGSEFDAPRGDAAPALRALRELAPLPDVYDTATAVLVKSRQQAVVAAVGHAMRGAGGGPASREVPELAAADPAGAADWLARASAPVRAAGTALGDPIVAWLLDETVREAAEATRAAARALRIERITRVLEVATDPTKAARLEATRAALAAEATADEAGTKARLARSRQAMLATLATPADVKTFEAVLGERTAGGGSPAARATLAAGVDDARRVATVTLAAYLRALDLPVPETLK